MKTYLALAILVLLAGPVYGKNLYVNNSNPLCSDATTYANNTSVYPWCTIGRASWGSTSRSAQNTSQAAQAGDTVYVAAGTYTGAGTGNRFEVLYSTANSGTANNPIVFEAVGVVVLALNSGAGPLIGAYGRDYITWRGFYIDELNAPSVSDTGPAVLAQTTGSVIEHCVIDGNGTANNRMDNHTGIRLEYAENVVVRRNIIHSVTTGLGATHHNGAGVQAYFSDNALIENNEIYSCGAGVYIKGGDNTNFTVRYNKLYSNGNGVDTSYLGADGEHNIYQNVIYNNFSGIAITLHSRNVNFFNNTLFNNSNGIRLGTLASSMSDIVIKNNIIHGPVSEYISGGEAESAAPFWIDYNMYYGTSNGWSIDGVLYTDIANWRTSLGGTNNGDESHSAVLDPTFVDLNSLDFKLQEGSPALTFSDTVGPIGAYITGNECIGAVCATPVPDIIFDDFEYEVDRDTVDDALKFRYDGLGVWDGVKSSQNTGQDGARGYLYTVDSIPGFPGEFPSGGDRVLCMEFLPDTLGFQTDAYLFMGSAVNPEHLVPSKHWIQFWLYINNYGEQATQWSTTGAKWIYPCVDGSPTCSYAYVSYLALFKPISYNPFNETTTGARVYPVLECTGCNYTPGSDPGVHKIGHNISSQGGLIYPNQWVLVKIHVDHSGSAEGVPPGQGVYEEWHMPQGQAYFTKVAEWKGGVTPDFTWDVTTMGEGYSIGNESLKLGTTFNDYDVWLYIDDFAIASSEALLPTYAPYVPVEPTCESTPDLCSTQSACIQAGWNWCTDVCQLASCPDPSFSTFMIFNNTGRPAVFDSGEPATFGE